MANLRLRHGNRNVQNLYAEDDGAETFAAVAMTPAYAEAIVAALARLSSAEAKVSVVRMMARQWAVADQMTGDAASPHDATLAEVGKALLAALDDTEEDDRG